ncbi:MAG TPA: hypothetical protein VFV52_14000 [Bacilli bacterium]|nr:hypothetical protein [Bacilli bacterium]
MATTSAAWSWIGNRRPYTLNTERAQAAGYEFEKLQPLVDDLIASFLHGLRV